MIFSYALTYGIAKNAGWGVSYWFLLLLAVMHAGILYGRKRAKEKKIPLMLAVLLLVLTCIILSLFQFPWFMYFWNFADNMSSWQGNGPMNLKYGWLVLYAMIVLGELCYRKLTKFIQVKLVLSLVIIGVLIWQATAHAGWEVLPVAAFLYVALCGFTEAYQRLIQKRKEIFAKDMMPFLIGVVLFISILPNGMHPISWDPVKQFCKQLQEGANELVCDIAFWGENSDFGVGNIGFSDDQNSFWGKLADGFSRDMMKLSVNSSFGTEEKYFAGIIKEKYENNNWSKIDTQDEQELTKENVIADQSGKYRYGVDGIGTKNLSEYQWELEEHLYYLYQSGLLSTDQESFCRANTYFLQYDNLRTQTLFYPANCYRIRVTKATDQINSIGPNICFADKQKKGNSYQVFGMQMNFKNENLVDYLRKESGIRTTDIKAANEKTDASTDSETLFMECADALNLGADELAEITDKSWEEKIADREKSIAQTDLQLPDQLPSRVQELAEKITADDENDYDKAQSIIRYLKKTGGYTYTTSPDEPDEEKDVVDSFLFESKKGYCSYFASAATILCRCAGIPARYVEGIVVEYKGETDGWYPVLGKSTHAWTQVYIHGFGWIDLDATPGYETGNGSWKEQSNEYQKYGQDSNSVQSTNGKSSADTKATTGQTRIQTVTSFVPYLGIGLVIILGCFLLVFAAGRVISYHAYRRSAARKRTEICMGRLFHYLKKRGLTMGSGETLRMYGRRLMLEQEENPEYLKVLQWYEAVRYGNQEVSDQEVAWLEQVCRQERIRNRKVKRERRKQHGKKGKKTEDEK